MKSIFEEMGGTLPLFLFLYSTEKSFSKMATVADLQ